MAMRARRADGAANVAPPTAPRSAPTGARPPWHRRFRMLLGIYAVAVAVGVREYLVARDEPVDMTSPAWSDMASVVEEVNPEDPDTDFLRAMRAMRDGDEEAFMRYAERALDSGVKHNDILLRTYAQNLLSTGQDWRLVNWAVNRWRRNHPSSAETLALPLGQPPRDEAEAELLREELRAIPWIADAQIEEYTDAGQVRWRVQITFVPPHEVDIRRAVEATTYVSLTPEQRARYTVRCSTLSECTLVPRTGT